MIDLNKYIQEKLVINNDTKREKYQTLDYDARTFKPNDILYVHPNIVSKNGYKGGIPSFFKVIKNDKKKLTIAPLKSEYIKKDSKGGVVVPDTSTVYNDVSVKIDKDGFAYYGSMVLYNWDEKEVSYWI